MVKLKKYRIHKAICDVCNGNGYVKVVHVDKKDHNHSIKLKLIIDKILKKSYIIVQMKGTHDRYN